MSTEEERVEQFLKKYRLVDFWIKHLLNEYAPSNSWDGLPGSHSEWLKVFRESLVEAEVPQKDIPYWSENLLLYLEYKTNKLSSRRPDETFAWYKENVKHGKTKFYLGLVIFIAIILIYTLILG